MVGTASMHEHDERWTAMDKYALHHMQPPSLPFSEALRWAEKHQIESGLPDIAVSAMQGQFLQLQAKLIDAKHILELGTLGGYSTIWLASAAPGVRVVTIEHDEKHAQIARQSIEHAGLKDRVEIILGDATTVLKGLKDDCAGLRPKFDMTFIDADKPNNWTYLDLAIQISRQGACLIVDNVVRRGMTADASLAETDAAVVGSRKVIENAGRDARIDSTVMQIVGEKNYDGFLICRRK